MTVNFDRWRAQVVERENTEEFAHRFKVVLKQPQIKKRLAITLEQLTPLCGVTTSSQDIEQEVFVVLYPSRQELLRKDDYIAGEYAYLRKAVENKLRDLVKWHRRQKRTPHTQLAVHWRLPEFTGTGGPIGSTGSDDQLSRLLLKENLAELRKSFTGVYRDVLDCHLERLGILEVAEASTQHVSVRDVRSRNPIRETAFEMGLDRSQVDHLVKRLRTLLKRSPHVKVREGSRKGT